MDNEARPDLEIPDSDEQLLAECRVDTFRAGGPGGQHQNTTESGVRLLHLPSGLRAVAREERSQHRNRARALERLRSKLEELMHRETPRVSTRVPQREREKRLGDKRKRGHAKRLRKPPDPEHD